MSKQKLLYFLTTFGFFFRNGTSLDFQHLKFFSLDDFSLFFLCVFTNFFFKCQLFQLNLMMMTDENEVAKVYIQKFYIDCNLTGRRRRKKPTDAKWRYKQQNMEKNNKDFGLTLVLNALKSCSYSTITASASIFFNINH